MIIEQLRSNTGEESETVSLHATGIQSLGILLRFVIANDQLIVAQERFKFQTFVYQSPLYLFSWFLFSIVLSINIYLYGADFADHHQMYMYVGLLIVLFVSTTKL